MQPLFHKLNGEPKLLQQNIAKNGSAPMIAALRFSASLFCNNKTKAHKPDINDQLYMLKLWMLLASLSCPITNIAESADVATKISINNKLHQMRVPSTYRMDR